MSNSVRLAAGVLEQGTDEALAYLMDFQKLALEFGTPISVASCHVYDNSLEDLNVDQKLSDVASLSGTVATSRLFSYPLVNHLYQLNVALNFPGGRVISGYFQIVGRL